MVPADTAPGANVTVAPPSAVVTDPPAGVTRTPPAGGPRGCVSPGGSPAEALPSRGTSKRMPAPPVSTSRALRAPGEVGLIVTAKVAVSPGATVVGPPDETANAPSASPMIVGCAIVIGV